MQVQIATCEKCGHQWIMRVLNPLKCSRCGHIRGASVKDKKAEGATIQGGTPKAQGNPTVEEGKPIEQ